MIAVDRGRYTCVVDDHEVIAMRARELGRKSVVVGDRVDIVGDTSGRPDTLSRIVRIAPRRSVLRRTADDDDPTERVIVANADQLVIVSSLADPPPRTGFIDRCLVAAYDADITALLCLTKYDLVAYEVNPAAGDADSMEGRADRAAGNTDQAAGNTNQPAGAADQRGAACRPVRRPPVLDYYADLDLDYVATRQDRDPEALSERLTGTLSVLVGHSGVGKSTLVNQLVPGADRAVGVVSAIGKGRHTSASAVVMPLPGGGWIVDTPGVRSFGLAHVSAASLLHGFPDLVAGADECPPRCDHTSEAPECALGSWVEAGNADPRRLASYRRLLASRTTED